ncbi:MAG: HPr(Ser) kinase/phosphatase [Myxococcota bacterium]
MQRRVASRELLEEEAADLQLRLLAGQEGLERSLHSPRIQKPGLALAGFTSLVHKDRVQILGSTELAYIESLPPERRLEACRQLCACEPAVLICTKGMEVPASLVEAAEESKTPLLRTPQVTSVFIDRVQSWLEERLAPQTSLHGVLVDVFGVGVLLLGKSGIGKSECALDLVQRGHRLVTDDVVQMKRRGEETVYATGHSLLKHHIEIRGLGILNVKDMFGVAAVRDKKRVDLVVELVAWSEDEEYDRLGLDERRFPILDVELPLLTVPVRPGRNMGAIVEVAARNQLLRSMGIRSAEELQERLSTELGRGRRAASDDVD